MREFWGNHSIGSALHRFGDLVKTLGLIQAIITIISAVDDKYLKTFDRRYRVSTCGYVVLNQTGFDPRRLPDATNYAPTNGWAVRQMLREWALPKKARFADLGSGMGRTCILGAEYGFAHVTGVELAPELCKIARANIASCRPPSGSLGPITILHRDALDFCQDTDDDVFFMFRPFSADFLKLIVARLAERARARQIIITILYSERAALRLDHAPLIESLGSFKRKQQLVCFGQTFYRFECDGRLSPAGLNR